MKEMKIAVISDSHGIISQEVIQRIRDCDCVLHAGDILRETDLDLLAVYKPIYAVRGNCDILPWCTRLQDTLYFNLAGFRFAMVHDRRNAPRNLDGVHVIVHGHTHHYSEEWLDGRLWLNPGSCGAPRFGGEATMAVLSVRDESIAAEKICLQNSFL